MKVQQVMSREVRYCYEDQEIDEVAENMAQIQVQRLPVLNCEKRPVDIVSLGDIAAHAGEHPAGRAASGIKQPGGPHAT